MGINKTQRSPKWLAFNRIAPVAAAILAGILIWTRPARSDPPDTGTESIKIRIANPAKIAESIKEYQDLIGKMDLDRKSLQATITEKQQALNELKQGMAYLKQGTDPYAQEEDKLLKASIEYDAWAKETELDLQRKQKDQIKALFLEIEDAIAKVATKENINLVIADQRPEIPENIDQIDVATLRQFISQRTILYSDSKYDISGEVITQMDQEYADKNSPH
jgi:Skp family chaperone for outer membrane proteins